MAGAGVKVKICGITNICDAQAAVDAGCDALGFIFYKKSPRYITIDKARGISGALPKNIIKIGVFVNAREKTIKRIALACGLGMLQFHGDESADFCMRFKGYKVIKAFRVKGKLDLNKIKKYNTFAYLFDTYIKTSPGGTGKNFDWQLVPHISKLKKPVFLSGGLNIRNVKKAISIVRPHWIDVSTCLEKAPGIKDHKKVKKIIKIVKSLKPRACN